MIIHLNECNKLTFRFGRLPWLYNSGSWRSDITVIEGSKMEAIKLAEVHAASLYEEEKKSLMLRLEEKQLECEKYRYKLNELESQLIFKESELHRYRIDLEVRLYLIFLGISRLWIRIHLITVDEECCEQGACKRNRFD